jgi:hypothetical protein
MPGNYSIKSASIMVMPIMATAEMYFSNRLYEAPSEAKIQTIDNKKYGLPQFRLKKRAGIKEAPDAESVWFEQDEATKKITFHCSVEVCREEPDVIPLFIRNPQINLEFKSGAKTIKKSLAVTPSPMFKDPINVVQDLHAQTEIASEEIKDLLNELKDESKFATFNIDVSSELWWQQIPVPEQPKNTGVIMMGPKIFQATVSEAAPVATGSVRAMRKFASAAAVQVRPQIVAAQPETSAPAQPQKIDLNHRIIKGCNKQNREVFGPLSSDFEMKGLNWKTASLLKPDGNYTIYYRPTTQPDKFFFLPQAFRIKAKELTGEPKITISMLPGDNPEKPELYRINIGITILPYYNPKAKRDLYETIRQESNDQLKHCGVILGGYTTAHFKIRDSYAGENAVLRGKVQETVSSVDAVNGFTLNIDCSLESFDFFKREISDGEWLIGDIVFDLISDDEGREITKTAPIPVELDIRKLVGIPTDIDTIKQKNPELNTDEIKGYKISNNNGYPVTISGAELFLLSKIQSTVYEADYEIGVQARFPITIPNKRNVAISFKEEDVGVLNGSCWTELICEPWGVSISSPPDQVLAKLIDYATGDPEIWKLEISCPLFERWAELDQATLAPYSQVHRVDVEIKNEEGQVFSVKLDKAKPVASLEMSRNISQILKSQQLSSRKYQYKVGTVYIVDPTKWTDWLNPESTAGNFLSVIPQKLV